MFLSKYPKSIDVDLEALHKKPPSISSNPQSNLSSDKHPSPTNILSKFSLSIKIDSKMIYDAILGLSDGLTVPFALTAGLASIGTTHIVILGGLAELVAGAISMGLGGFIGAKSEYETYQATSLKCTNLITNSPHQIHSILEDHFKTYNLPSSSSKEIMSHLLSCSSLLHPFLMTHHYQTTKPDTSRPYISAFTLGLSYFLAGFIALIPYFCVKEDEVLVALWWSIGIMGLVMLIFGYVKTGVVRGWRGRENVLAGVRGGGEMLVVGGVAVGAAVGLVKVIERGAGFGG